LALVFKELFFTVKGRGRLFKSNILRMKLGVLGDWDQLLVHNFAYFQMFSSCFYLEKSTKWQKNKHICQNFKNGQSKYIKIYLTLNSFLCSTIMYNLIYYKNSYCEVMKKSTKSVLLNKIKILIKNYYNIIWDMT
jgi:hypothetical protein